MPTDKPAQSFDFGAKLAELEAITETVDSDGLDLDDAVSKFERGMQLAAQLKEHLTQVENRVEKIKARYAEPAEESRPVTDAPPVDDPFDVPSFDSQLD